MKHPLCIFVSYAQKHLCNQSSHYEKCKWSCTSQTQVLHPSVIVCQTVCVGVAKTPPHKQSGTQDYNYPLKREASIKSFQLITNQDLVEKHLCNDKVVTMKNMDDFHYACKGTHHMQPMTKSTLFVVGKDEWNTKEDTS